MSRAKNWCFTLNNYTDADIARLAALGVGGDPVAYVIFGKEIGQSGTPHLQGFVQFENRLRINGVKEYVGDRAHVEAARDIQASIAYCKKEGFFTEVGELAGGRGSRNDLDGFKESVRQGVTDFRLLREEHSKVWARFPRFCQEYVRDHIVRDKAEEHEYRPWQRCLLQMLEAPPGDRHIIFVVDALGNQGKTWFTKRYQDEHKDAQIILPGKVVDMAYALREDVRVVFMDCPRSKQGEFIQYDFLEHIKNGMVFSSKYESYMKRLKKVHVVVFMNEPPDMTKLSRDRYIILTIRQTHDFVDETVNYRGEEEIL